MTLTLKSHDRKKTIYDHQFIGASKNQNADNYTLSKFAGPFILGSRSVDQCIQNSLGWSPV